MAFDRIKKIFKQQYDPERDTGDREPIKPRIVGKDASDKYSDYPSSGLDPAKLARILKAADTGDVRAQMELYEDIEEKDLHLSSQMQTRKLAVMGLEWEVQPFSEETQDKEISEFVNEQLKGLKNLDKVFLDILDAIGKGISINEIIWGVDNKGQNVIKDIEYVHPKKIVWDSQTDALKICTKQYPYGIEIPKRKFVIHEYKAKSGHTSRAGVMRVVSWMYLFKNFTIKDWVSFCEVYGMPLRLGKYQQGASDEDKEQLFNAILQLGADAAGIVADTTSIEFIEAQKQSSIDVFERLARYADEQMSKAILGQTLTADSGGSHAQSKTHDKVRHDLMTADAKSLATTIRRDIIKPLVIYNYGANANIPFFAFDTDEAEDQKEKAEIYKTLVCDMGLQIPTKHIYQFFRIPTPEEGDEILKPPQAQQQMVQHSGADGAAALTLKDDKTIQSQTEEQEQLDQIVAIANAQSAKIFDTLFEPVLKLVDNKKSLEELQEYLNNDDNLLQLYQDMDGTELNDLIQQATYISKLIGRTTQ